MDILIKPFKTFLDKIRSKASQSTSNKLIQPGLKTLVEKNVLNSLIQEKTIELLASEIDKIQKQQEVTISALQTQKESKVNPKKSLLIDYLQQLTKDKSLLEEYLKAYRLDMESNKNNIIKKILKNDKSS